MKPGSVENGHLHCKVDRRFRLVSTEKQKREKDSYELHVEGVLEQQRRGSHP